jgi:DNA modification methylase
MLGDVLEYPSDVNLGHAAQKPVALFEDLLRRTCLPGNAVLDPFMGTGTIFTAAHPLKIRAVGVELDPAAYGIALARIEDLQAELELDLEL